MVLNEEQTKIFYFAYTIFADCCEINKSYLCSVLSVYATLYNINVLSMYSVCFAVLDHVMR